MINGFETALIVGAGDGLSASIARKLSAAGVKVALAARTITKLDALCAETGAQAYACDATAADDVVRLFESVEQRTGGPDIVVYNAGRMARGAFLELDAAEVAASLAVGATGAFLVGQQAARRMAAKGAGAIVFTGATASLRGSARFAPFAMGKFAARALAQSMARELGPMGIHVAHVVIDGVIRSARHPAPADGTDDMLDPDSIAALYLDLIAQPRSGWTHELDVRSATERF